MVYALYVLRNIFFNLLNKSQQIEKCYFLSFLSAFFPLSLYPILYFPLSFSLVFLILSFISTSYPSFPCFPYIIFYFQRLILLSLVFLILSFIFNVLSFFSLILSSFSFILFPCFPIYCLLFPFPFFFFYKENYQFLSLKWYTFIFGVFFISIFNL